MKITWNILYRGSLSSCNYACDYCPFAKTKNTRAELAIDAQQVTNFVDWVQGRQENIGILFTPWGEGLIRKYYQEAMIKLSHFPNVYKVAIQSNLSCATEWLSEANPNKIALWTTYHPSEVSKEKFLNKCYELDALGIQYSVGMVGFVEFIPLITEIREALSPDIYLWVNAYKREKDYYQAVDIEKIKKIDPLFQYNLKYHPSLGKDCRAGYTTFSVDGEGNISRCHFIKKKLSNIYEAGFEKAFQKTPCTNLTCACHIGYVHLNELHLYDIFGEGVLERIPQKNFLSSVADETESSHS